MGNFEALVYGVVQGVAEYLPISSSAHLMILPHIFGEKDPGLAFDVILHFGTLLATIVYFFSTWVQILQTPFPKPDAHGVQHHLSWMHFIVGTLPAVIVGLLLNHWIQDHTRSLVVLWITLPVFGVFLWWADRFRPSSKTMSQASLEDMLFIGCMQSLSLVPGVSRSGSTITAARLRGFNRIDSARVSFLLSMPVTLGAIVYEGRHWRELVESVSGFAPLLIACGSALFFGGMAIHFLLRWLSKTSFAVFAVYRVLAGILLALFFKAE